MAFVESPSQKADQGTSDESPGDSSASDREPHPDSAPFAFVDTLIESLVSASPHVAVDDVELAQAKLRLAITLLDIDVSGRGPK